MNDDLEPRLRDAFHRDTLPVAPATLLHRLERVPDVVPAGRRRGARSIIGLLVAAVLLVVAGSAVLTGGSSRTPAPTTPAATPGPPGLHLEFMAQPVGGVAPTAADMARIVTILEARVAATGVAGGTVTSTGGDRIEIVMPGVTEPGSIARTIGQTGRIDFVPLGDQSVNDGDVIDTNQHPPIFGWDGIQSAGPSVDQNGGPALSLVLKPETAVAFATYTAANIGGWFAIVLDGVAIAAPVIQDSIPDGEVEVTFGGPDPVDPTKVPGLVAVIGSGPLPFPLELLSSKVVAGSGATPS